MGMFRGGGPDLFFIEGILGQLKIKLIKSPSSVALAYGIFPLL
jgi:hypothetical protein